MLLDSVETEDHQVEEAKYTAGAAKESGIHKYGIKHSQG
jgi:hypothetical protein